MSIVRVRIRVAGIKGLQGVVRKTVNDELQAIIWEPQHMDKLIPSMLFNMQDSEDMDRYHTHIQYKAYKILKLTELCLSVIIILHTKLEPLIKDVSERREPY